MILLIARFLLFAAIYLVIILSWAEYEGGHGAMALVAAGILLAGPAAVACSMALTLERWVLPARSLLGRIIFHTVTTTTLFLALGSVVLIAAAFPMAFDQSTAAFLSIVALAALASGVLGAARNRPKAAVN